MIAYDSNILVCYLENHSAFADAAAGVIEASHRQGAVVSCLLVQEVLTGFALRSKADLHTAQEALAALHQTAFAEVTPHIAQRAAELTAQFGAKLTGYDAIHVATALEHGASHFYTNDKDVAKLGTIEGLKITPLVSIS